MGVLAGLPIRWSSQGPGQRGHRSNEELQWLRLARLPKDQTLRRAERTTIRRNQSIRQVSLQFGLVANRHPVIVMSREELTLSLFGSLSCFQKSIVIWTSILPAQWKWKQVYDEISMHHASTTFTELVAMVKQWKSNGRMHLLWKEFFKDPRLWFDNRLTKVSSTSEFFFLLSSFWL